MNILIHPNFYIYNSIYPKYYLFQDLDNSTCNKSTLCTLPAVCSKCENLRNFNDFMKNMYNKLPFRNKATWYRYSSLSKRKDNLLTNIGAITSQKENLWHTHYYHSCTVKKNKKFLSNENYPGETSGFLIFYKKINLNDYVIYFCASHPYGPEWDDLIHFV